jgi:hypothetical protein
MPAPAGLGQLLRQRARERHDVRPQRLPPDRLAAVLFGQLLGPPLQLAGVAVVVTAGVEGSLPWSLMAALALLMAALSTVTVSADTIRSASPGRSLLRPARAFLLLLAPIEGIVYRQLVAAVETLASLACCCRRR